nr:MAG TPA: hypothetical protein [Caudoviricetes sp.]
MTDNRRKGESYTGSSLISYRRTPNPGHDDSHRPPSAGRNRYRYR